MVKSLAAALAVFVFMITGTVHAQQVGASCAAAKLKAAGAKTGCKLKIESAEAKKGIEEDETKLAACEGKFSAAFAKADSKPPCVTNSDMAAIEAKVDAFVNDVANTLSTEPPATPSSCDGGKIKAAGSNAACRLKLESGAEKKGLAPDSAKVAACGSKMAAAFAKAEAKPPCTATGGSGTIQAKVDAFVNDVKAELTMQPTTTSMATTTTSTSTTAPACAPIVVGQPIPNTYRVQGTTGEKRCTTNSAANRFGTCTSDIGCGNTLGSCLNLPWVTADGQVMPFPTGTQTTFTVAASDAFPSCEHSVCIPCGNANASCPGIAGCEVAGNPNGCIPRGTQGCCDQPGFIVPTFFVNILGGLCSRVDQMGCGGGVVHASNPQTGHNKVTKNADTSDPGADCCYNGHPGSECLGGVNLNDDPAPLPCTLAGAGNDYKGKISRSVGGPQDANGIHYRLVTPELSTTWQDAQSPTGTCANGAQFDDGELLVSQIILKAEPTTSGAEGSFTSQNAPADTCKRAGAGFINIASPDTDGPIFVPGAPAGPARPQAYNGSTGSVAAAVSEVFSGPNSPIRDIGFVAITPNMPAVVVPSQSCSCTVQADCPE